MQLSVIIPTLNEQEYLANSIKFIKRHGSKLLLEIIVVDCGSSDATVKIAKSFGCKVLSSKPGNKWRPLNIGAQAARGDTLMFVDADTLVPQGYASAIQNVLEKPQVVGGAFEFALKEKGISLRIIEWGNRIRYRIWQRYYGDQGIFVRRNIFEQVDGFPQIDILEAAYFCLRIRKLGKLKLIRMPATTSARRFIEGGVFRVVWHDFKILLFDSLGFSVEKHGELYWQENQKRGDK